MKIGKYFSIPETAAELNSWWQSGEPIDTAVLPHWLSNQYRPYFRKLSQRALISSGGPHTKIFAAEFHEIQTLGIIIEPDPQDSALWHLYMRKPISDNWAIGIYSGSTPASLSPSSTIQNPVLTREDVTDILAMFVADPFLIHTSNGWFMFFEVMNGRRLKGEIAFATSVDALHWKYEHVILSEAFHLSYPFVFQFKDSYYMIPETFESHSVRLYRAVTFPTEWQFVATLISCPYIVDATPIYHNSRWYLFAETSHRRRHDTLRLYFADDLLGPWYSHPQNPICTKPTAARPAGRIIRWDDKLIRYGQVCIPAYGTAIRAFEISELTTRTFVERELQLESAICSAGFGWNANGMHHIDPHLTSPNSWVAAVDGY